MDEVLEVQGEVTCSKLDNKSEELYRKNMDLPIRGITWGTEKYVVTSAKPHKKKTLKQLPF